MNCERCGETAPAEDDYSNIFRFIMDGAVLCESCQNEWHKRRKSNTDYIRRGDAIKRMGLKDPS